MQSGFGEGNGSDFRLVPDMPASGGHREFAFTGRFIIDREIDRVVGGAVERRDFILSLLDDIHGVVAPFAVTCPADVELVRCRGEEIRMIEVREVLGVRSAARLEKTPYIPAGMI